ncbi:MAG TPA: hypothetical protein VNV44_02480 [Solirubrobacteraceae bacterium]|jgi:hypothetical protein|nr:hypothetical protein [Solirubrobacteraceae bacterium]
MSIRKLTAALAVALTLSLVAVAGAQASVVRWWVAPPVGELTPGTPLTVGTAAKLKITENTGAIGKCVIKDVEVVENPASSTLSGVDQMTAFTGLCKQYPYPCTTSETVSVSGVGLPWPSVLTEPSAGVFADSFSGVAIEFKCQSSGATAIYTASLFEPRVLTNKLVFTFANNALKFGIHEIHFMGVDKLIPTGGFTKIRAK